MGSPWVAGRDWAPESSVSGVRSLSSLSLSASLLLARSAKSLWMPAHHHTIVREGWLPTMAYLIIKEGCMHIYYL